MFALERAEVAALQQPNIDSRNFVSLRPKDRETGVRSAFNFWSDGGPYTGRVVDALTGLSEFRAFSGGGLVSVGSIPRTSDITIRRVEVVLSAIDANAENAFRGYDCRQAPIQVYRGLFTPGTFNQIAAAKPVFVGYIDEAPVITPAEGGAAKVTLQCVSYTVELTRKNPAVRSHESQIARAPGDDFYKDVNSVAEWEVNWGKANAKGKALPGIAGFNGFYPMSEA